MAYRQLDKKFQKLASKYLRKIQIEKKVVYVNQRIEPTTTAEQLSKVISVITFIFVCHKNCVYFFCSL